MATPRKTRDPRPTTSVEAPTLSGRERSLGPGDTAPAGSPSRYAPVAAELEGAVTGTVRAVQSLLPNRLPVVLGIAALLTVGALEPPVALAGGLAYEALRRWQPNGPRHP